MFLLTTLITAPPLSKQVRLNGQ